MSSILSNTADSLPIRHGRVPPAPLSAATAATSAAAPPHRFRSAAATPFAAPSLLCPGAHHPRRPSGYSMGEILVALGIFIIGFIAVAAIFPAATHTQKQTTDEVLVSQIAESVKALLQARPFSISIEGKDLSDLNDSTAVQPLPGQVFQNKWTFRDRSFPSDAPVVLSKIGPYDNVAIPTAKYYWTPLIRRTVANSNNPADFVVYVFITRGPGQFPRNPDLSSPDRWAVKDDFRKCDGWVDVNGDGNINIAPHTYWTASPSDDYFISPGIRSLAVQDTPASNIIKFASNANTDTHQADGNLLIRAGDRILDSNGNIHIVTAAAHSQITVAGTIPHWNDPGHQPSAVWFALPQTPGALSPTVAIIAVHNAVIP